MVDASNVVDYIIAYESGDIGDDDFHDLFRYLVDSGMIFHLQGSYQRDAQMLLDQGDL